LARAVGGVRCLVPPAVARPLAAIGAAAALGFEDEVRRQAARASEMGVPEESAQAAVETGVGLRQVEPVE
jgi:alkylhydroperoxidase/carboxymuconolactone decarboxylase family protein YurZ